jgi:hypothetical protein
MNHVNLKSGGNFFHPNATHAQTTDFPHIILTQSSRPVARTAVSATAAKRTVPDAVLSVFLTSPPTQVPESVVALVPVQVPAFHADRLRTDERHQYYAVEADGNCLPSGRKFARQISFPAYVRA